MTAPEDITISRRTSDGHIPSVKAIAVEGYLYLSVVDP